MLLLAVDTSGKNGSLALVRTTPLKPKEGLNGAPSDSSRFEVLELVPLVGRMYSAQIIPELQNALARQNLKKTDIDAYAVASGPGSFTGLRVGLSTVKALSEVLHKPIAAVSVLEAAARVVGATGRVIVALDAGRKQVFMGEYEFGGEFNVLSAEESLMSLEAFLGDIQNPTQAKRGLEWGTQRTIFSPDQSVREAAALHGVEIREIAAPQADMFARIGYAKIIRGETTSADILEANYIRASDAELFSLPKLMP
jgi:tRNA threonylcarbamoyladenosine biosynthesis protein TsaB